MFEHLSEIYRPRWLSSIDKREIAGLIEAVRKEVLGRLNAVWAGGSESVDQWWRRACEPAVSKALDALVKQERTKAEPTSEKILLHGILRKLEQTATDATATPPAAPENAPNPAGDGQKPTAVAQATQKAGTPDPDPPKEDLTPRGKPGRPGVIPTDNGEGAELEERRRRHGYRSAAKFADLLDVATNIYRNVENGKGASLKTLCKIVKNYKTSFLGEPPLLLEKLINQHLPKKPK
jgi:hypothetical protein